MKVLLTGASGMVGKNILEHESASDYEFVCPSSQELNLTKRVEIDQFLLRLKPDLIIHCAGLVGGIQANISKPVDFLATNNLIGINLVSAARDQKVPNFLNLASSCMYPREAKNPLREDSLLSGKLEPTNEGYAIAKIVTAKLCEYVVREDQRMNYKTLIPCNLYGRHDHFDQSRSHLIPAVINKLHIGMVRGDPSVEIWGDGLARREFMYAGDLADFIFRAIPQIDELPQYMNVGLGYDYSVNDYYIAAAKVIGYLGQFHHDESRPVGMKQKLVDCSVQAALDWKPRTSLEEGLYATYEFYKEHIFGEI